MLAGAARAGLRPVAAGLANVAPARQCSRRSPGADEALATVDYEHVTSALRKKTLLVDVREPDELKEHGQIPSAINVPLGSVSRALGAMSAEEFERTYGRGKPPPAAEIIFYCQVGKRSQLAQLDALRLGYHHAKNYIGSYRDWCSRKS